MSPIDLSSFFRLYNFFRGSGVKEKEVESFITNINSGYITPGKAIEIVNQIYEISKSQSVSPDQLPHYIKQKLEEKQKIEEAIKEVDAVLRIYENLSTMRMSNPHFTLYFLFCPELDHIAVCFLPLVSPYLLGNILCLRL